MGQWWRKEIQVTKLFSPQPKIVNLGPLRRASLKDYPLKPMIGTSSSSTMIKGKFHRSYRTVLFAIVRALFNTKMPSQR